MVLCGVSSNARAADEAARESFDAKGVKIRYTDQGSGEPVVLIHGLYSSGDINWKLPGTVAALKKNYRVITPDMPGHGGSDKPEKEEAYGVQMAEDVILLLDHLKIKKAHIVGYSMGGMIAMKLIADHPDRVLSGTLGGMGWLRDGSQLQKVFEKAPVREANRAPSVCFASFAKLAITKDELKSVKVPMLVIVGDKDPCKKLYVEPLQAERKDWPVVEIEDAGHFTCIMKKQFIDEIVKWIDKNAQKKES
jgi:pimeloyl-ACP methyl ester carboxylesterase